MYITFRVLRDSKLTRLLADSLGGNANTVLIATVGLAPQNQVHKVIYHDLVTVRVAANITTYCLLRPASCIAQHSQIHILLGSGVISPKRAPLSYVWSRGLIFELSRHWGIVR